MKNKFWIVLILFLIVLICIGVFFFYKRNNSNSNTNNYNSSKISTNNYDESTNNSTNSSISDSNTIKNTTENIAVENQPKQPTEETITSFSTKIYSKDSARQNNIYITCSKLNDSIIKNDTTFSFCNTVGQATSSKGYQKADIFDKDGNKKKGFGGGNCQISTTLYNAVLQVNNLAIIERHEHSNKVPYISEGKDAAVAYGSYDLKFKNNTGNDIKIKAEANTNNVIITLLKIT